MLFKRHLIVMAVFFAAALALTGCGDKMEDFLNNSEKIIVKIEKLAAKKDFSDADYAEYQKLIQEYQVNSQKDAEALSKLTPTAKQAERGQDLGQRLAAAMMQCEMNQIGKSF